MGCSGFLEKCTRARRSQCDHRAVSPEKSTELDGRESNRRRRRINQELYKIGRTSGVIPQKCIERKEVTYR